MSAEADLGNRLLALQDDALREDLEAERRRAGILTLALGATLRRLLDVTDGVEASIVVPLAELRAMSGAGGNVGIEEAADGWLLKLLPRADEIVLPDTVRL